MSQLRNKINERTSNLVYDIRVLSLDTYVKMRPYNVREEKEYMIAESTKDIKVFMDTIKRIIVECSFNKLDIDLLKDYDIQFIMLQLKAKSKDDKVMLRVTCPNCAKEFNLKASLDLVNYGSLEQHSYEINIEDMVFYMQDPTLDSYAKMLQASEEELSLSDKLDIFIDVISDCITRVAFADSVIDFQSESKEDRHDFLYNINAQELDKLRMFFDSLPNFHYSIDCNCPACKDKISKTITGLNGFFYL